MGTEETEECATFYGRMLDHDYTTKEVFNKNFFKDWRKVMTEKEKDIIRDLSKCDFSEINEHFKKVSEERKNRSKEEKKAEKEKNDAIVEEYGFCTMDGHKEKIGNFRTEPPSLFRGRGEHPKQGMIKRRIMPEDVIINCSKDSDVPVPPAGHKWKKVQHDNTVTWLATWTENVQGQSKYVMLNPSSRLKGEKDWQKYEKARKLKTEIHKIREDYMEDMRKAKENETEEERLIRKEKERKARENETEEERRIRKEKERRKETDEERKIRKEKERKQRENETEEERRIRKEKERKEKKQETEEERAARKEKERRERKNETEEERAARKERERRERKEKEKAEKKPEVKEEMMELGDDYFAAEEARLEEKRRIKEEEQYEDEADIKQENGGSEDESKDGIIRQEVPCDDSDDDVPLAKRKKPAVKRKVESGDDSEDEPLSKKKAKVKKQRRDSYEDEEDFRPSKKMNKPSSAKKKKEEAGSPTKKMTKKEKELEAEKQVWKWWEEENTLPDGVKWRFLEHKGPMFAPDYEPLPEHVRFWYDGKTLRLTEETEECAT